MENYSKIYQLYYYHMDNEGPELPGRKNGRRGAYYGDFSLNSLIRDIISVESGNTIKGNIANWDLLHLIDVFNGPMGYELQPILTEETLNDLDMLAKFICKDLCNEK